MFLFLRTCVCTHRHTHRLNGKQDAAIDKCLKSCVRGSFLSSPPSKLGRHMLLGVPPFRVGQLQPKNKDFNGSVFPTQLVHSEFSA